MPSSDPTRDPRCFWVDGRVESSEFLGESTRYRVRVAAHSLAVDQPHRAGLQRLAPGQAVSLGFEPAQLRLFSA